MADSVPLVAPIAYTAWGVLCWFAGFRTLICEPHEGVRRMAEVRARSRLLHPLRAGNGEKEFAQQWRLRWIGYLAMAGYVIGTIALWIAALT